MCQKLSFRVLVGLFFWVSLAQAQGPAELDQDTVALKQRLDDFLLSTQSFTAQFKQSVVEPDSEEVVIETGKVWISRPSRLRWDYQEPFKRSVVADGTDIWEYDEDLKQAIVRPQADLIEQNPVVLLGDHGQLDKAFEVEGSYQLEGIEWLVLKPKAEAPDYRQVKLGFQSDALIAMEWLGNFEQTVRVDFTDVERNRKIDADVFVLATPADTAVVRQAVL